MNRGSVDSYLLEGCGRCSRYRTPACKVHRWTEPLRLLRAELLAAGLDEGMKWGSPCYMVRGRNVVLLASFNDACSLQFFDGVMLEDPEGLLEAPGPNSRTVRRLMFRSAGEVVAHVASLRSLIGQAMAIASSEGPDGRRPPVSGPAANAAAPELPVELLRQLEADPALAVAFAALTPGRRRSHLLHITGASQSATRERRVARCTPDILAGRGFNERARG